MGEKLIQTSRTRQSTSTVTVSLPTAVVSRVRGLVAIKEAKNFSEVVTHALRDWLIKMGVK
jgi:Arc/MetJ-type ribon-helix-helix transcriptional regulator